MTAPLRVSLRASVSSQLGCMGLQAFRTYRRRTVSWAYTMQREESVASLACRYIDIV